MIRTAAGRGVLGFLLWSRVTMATSDWDRAAALVDRWEARGVDEATLRREAGRLAWPLLPVELERELLDGAGAEPVDEVWARDRLLPVLAGELPVSPERMVAMLAAAGRGPEPTLEGLTAARRAYAEGRPAEAVVRYRSLAGTSEVWREAAWAHYAAGDEAHALGTGVTLASPWLPPEDHAEGRLSSAMVMRDHCRFDEARRLLAPLAELPPSVPPRDLMMLVLKREPAAESLEREVQEAPLVRRFREVCWTAGMPESGGGEARRRESFERMTALVRRTWDASVEARRRVVERAVALRYDTLRAERALRAKGWTPAAVQPLALPPLGDDEVSWAFDVTWWRDELGLYRSIAVTHCPPEAR